MYPNPVTRDAAIAFRGSVTASDWARTDVALNTGQLTKTARFGRSANELHKAKQQLKGYNVYTTGHSLGASLGEKLSATVRTAGHTGFNPGYGLADARPIRFRNEPSKYHNSRMYVNTRDVVSKAGVQRNDRSDTYYTRSYAAGAHRAAPTRWTSSGV